MKFRKLAAGLTAGALLTVGLAVAVPLSASAHTGDASPLVACQADGTYTVTWTYTQTNTPDTGDGSQSDVKVISHSAGTLASAADNNNSQPQIYLNEAVDHAANNHSNQHRLGNYTQTFTQSGIPGNATSASVGIQTDWLGWGAAETDRSVALAGTCTPPVTPPVRPPTAVCTSSTVDKSAWSSEDGSVSYTRNADGSVNGVSLSTVTRADKVNYFGAPVGQPLLGTTGSYTMASQGGAQAGFQIEIFRNAGVPITSNVGFATVVYEPYLNGYTLGGDGTSVTYTINANSIVWNSKLLGQEGGQDHPVTLARMSELFPNASVIRGGVGQGSGNDVFPGFNADVSTVSAFSIDCARTDFTGAAPIHPTAIVTHSPVTTTACGVDTATTVDTITTTSYSLNADRTAYVADAPVVTTTTTTRALTDAELAACPTATFPDGSQTCNTYTLPALDSTTEKYPLADLNDSTSRYTAGTHALTGTVTVVAHTLASANVAPASHTYTFTATDCPTTVTPPVTTPPTDSLPAPVAAALAFTGANPAPFIGAAILLLLAGGVLLISRRRKGAHV